MDFVEQGTVDITALFFLINFSIVAQNTGSGFCWFTDEKVRCVGICTTLV